MTIHPVNSAADGSSINVRAGTTASPFSQTATLAGCIARNSIFAFTSVVVAGGGGGFSAFTSGTPTLVDTLGNVYTLISWTNATFEGGPGLGLWIATGIAAGSATATFTFTAENGGISSPLDDVPFIAQVGLVQYPFASATVQDFDQQTVFGPSGGASLSITDSASGTVTATLPLLVTGNDWSFALVDLVVPGAYDYLIVCGMTAPSSASTDGTPPTITPSKYGLMVRDLESIKPPGLPGNDTVIYLWDQGQYPDLVPPTVACPDSAAPLGVPYSSAFVASGGEPPYSDYAITAGALATGLSLDSTDGDVTGTPTVRGVFDYTGQVTDRYGATGSTDCSMEADTLDVACHYAQIGVPFVDQLQPSGGVGPFTFALTGGSLPDGLTLDGTTGKISGTPTTLGPFSFSFQVTDSFGLTASATCSILVGSGPPPVSGDLCIYAGAVGH